jgi:hypothetical protein
MLFFVRAIFWYFEDEGLVMLGLMPPLLPTSTDRAPRGGAAEAAAAVLLPVLTKLLLLVLSALAGIMLTGSLRRSASCCRTSFSYFGNTTASLAPS